MNNSRILDRTQYAKKTLDTFEMLASYFIDIYYNHLYIEAKKLKINQKVHNITEGYKHTLNAYIQGIDNPALYKKTLVGIHSFYIDTGFSSISFTECIERITCEFLPKDFYASVSKQQKTAILRLVINNANRVFIEKLCRKFLSLIIDTHEDADNIRVLQDEFIDVLILERETMYHRFIKQKTSGVQISPGVAEAMQTEIKKLCNEKYEMKTLVTNLKKIILKKEGEAQQYKSAIEQLQNKVNELEADRNYERNSAASEKSAKSAMSNKSSKSIVMDAVNEIENRNLSSSVNMQEPNTAIISNVTVDPQYLRTLNELTNVISSAPKTETYYQEPESEKREYSQSENTLQKNNQPEEPQNTFSMNADIFDFE